MRMSLRSVRRSALHSFFTPWPGTPIRRRRPARPKGAAPLTRRVLAAPGPAASLRLQAGSGAALPVPELHPLADRPDEADQLPGDGDLYLWQRIPEKSTGLTRSPRDDRPQVGRSEMLGPGLGRAIAGKVVSTGLNRIWTAQVPNGLFASSRYFAFQFDRFQR